MAKLREIYHCALCGNIVEVEVGGKGKLYCCGAEMTLMEPQTKDSTKEKHVPYIEKAPGGFLVKVGQNEAHPMLEKHYIAYIEICADGVLMRKYLKPGDKPEAFFKTDAKKVTAWELCNLHGVWTA
ncbi:MAG: desulfoferrodoxin [Thermoplasmatales archaeon]|nr:desulfoferrodoxin [Thermoplasmatales archaeon]